MQAAKSNRVHLGENLNPLKDAQGVESIDFSADIDNLIEKLDKLSVLYDTGKMDADVIKYIPGMSKVSYQGQIDFTDTKRTYAASTYTDMQQLEFNLEVVANHCINFSNMVVCFPMAFRKRTNKAQAINANIIPVNSFFAHWIKDITVKRYGDDIAVLPINTTLKTYRYSKSMLKHLPDDVLATFQKDLLYSNKKVIIKGNAASTLNDRRNHKAAAANNSETDANINDRIAKFNNNNALFTIEPDANVYWNSIPYVKYELVKLNDNFDTYISKALKSKKVLRTGIKPTPYQKSYEVNVGTQSHVIEFKGLNKQFSFFEISLVYDKSEQHNSVYDSYNAELAATHIGSVQLENLNNKYSEINRKLT